MPKKYCESNCELCQFLGSNNTSTCYFASRPPPVPIGIKLSLPNTLLSSPTSEKQKNRN